MKPGTIEALQRSIEKKLAEKYNDPTLCLQYSWWILEALTGQKKEQLIARSFTDLTPQQLDQLDEWMESLVNKSKPLQYIMGTAPFMDLKLFLKIPTLIPRPETEEMSADLVDQLEKLKNQKINVLDIGTGTGCIGLLIAKSLPNAQVYATDIADTALELAQINAKENNVENITFIKSDVYNSIPSGLQFDLIVSNPPYISLQEWNDLDDSVTQWEDRGALIAQKEGLAIIERIAQDAPKFLRENKEMERHNIPQLVLEIGYKQGQAVSKLLENAGFDAITIKKDLEGKDRVVTGRVKNVAVQPEKT